MELVMQIKNVKSIKDITFSFPLERGLYAITGENASGGSGEMSVQGIYLFQLSRK